MNKILTAALLALAFLGVARADPLPVDLEGRPVSPQWTRLENRDGAVYFVALNTIQRVRGTGPIAGNVSMMVYSDKQHEFYTMLFDCRGSFMLWSDPATVRTIRAGTMARVFEQAACAL